jgi:hypothetical protein
MICPHCGDWHTDKSKAHHACADCAAELRDGTIPPAEVITHSRGGGSYGPTDDSSPGNDDAIRALEDCR